MPESLPLLNGRITLAEALDADDDILQQLSYPEKRLDFYVYLYGRREEIEAIVSYHLGVLTKACRIGEVREWIHGSFNVCIPVYIDDSVRYRGKKVIIRFPLPYKVGESKYPGNAEEKLRCEVATYVWIQSNCPTVPTPRMWGFGFPGGQSFTALGNCSFHTRFAWYFQRTVSWMLRYPLPSRYVGHTRPQILGAGYLVVDYVEEGRMLSESWETLCHDRNHRANLFEDLSRIMLSLAQLPLPRIGSLTIDNHGVLSLTNRPLTLALHQLENGGIPTSIGRNLTYSTTDAYLLDLLACHDSRIWHQPNSILDKSDGEAQLSALTIMRALLLHFTNRDLRHGPFVLILTDLHQSNIFVDSNWHITRVIDLEWACARPIEMLHPPYWLTSRGIDGLVDEHLEAYSSLHREFMDAFEREERLLAKADTSYTHILQKGWEMGNFWYSAALDCPKGLYGFFIQHIQPRFADLGNDGIAEFDRTVTPYWHTNASKVIATKIKDREVYTNRLRELFEKDGHAGQS